MTNPLGRKISLTLASLGLAALVGAAPAKALIVWNFDNGTDTLLTSYGSMPSSVGFAANNGASLTATAFRAGNSNGSSYQPGSGRSTAKIFHTPLGLGVCSQEAFIPVINIGLDVCADQAAIDNLLRDEAILFKAGTAVPWLDITIDVKSSIVEPDSILVYAADTLPGNTIAGLDRNDFASMFTLVASGDVQDFTSLGNDLYRIAFTEIVQSMFLIVTLSTGDLDDFKVAQIRAIPEPATLSLVGLGLIAVGAASRRKAA